MPSSTANDRSVELRSAAIILWCLALTAIALRCYVRIGMMKAFSVDDYFMIFAMVSFTCNTVTSVLGTFYGSGRHMTDLVPENAVKAMMYWWACYPTFAISMVLSKFSVGFFLLRITTQKIHRWIIYAVMGVTLASSTAFFFVSIFQCTPVDFAWTRLVSTDGRCMELSTLINVTYVYSTFAIIADFTFTLLPAWLVWNLQMDKKTKFAIIPILSMACIASCAVAVRLGFVTDFANPDFLWATTDIAIWSQTEQGLAIAAGSFATLRPLFRLVLAKLGLSGNASNYSGRTPNSGSRSGIPGVSKFKSSTFGSSKNSTNASNTLYSMSTFKRIDDDDAEKGMRSTSELNSPVSPTEGKRERVVSDIEYRVEIQTPPRVPPKHQMEFEDAQVHGGNIYHAHGDRF